MSENENNSMDVISKDKIERYLDITSRALRKVKIIAPEPSYIEKIAKDYFNMAASYYKDAVHFYEQGDYINAFASVNYAHGWLDAGARLGVFHVDGDGQLFTLLE